jgi:hypothetical protein
VEVDAENGHEAMNSAFNALAQFACQRFPPPESVEIKVMNPARKPVGAVRFTFEIEYAESIAN